MNCKKCQAELENGVTLCPECGTENAEPAKTGLSAGKITLLVVLAIAAVAVIAALFAGNMSVTEPAETTVPTTVPGETAGESAAATIPADGNPDDVTCKGTYSVTDEQMLAAKDTVVATMGDAKLTNGQLQVYYWMQVYDFLNQYAGYADMIGLDCTQPLEQQISIDGNLSWQQYFLDGALTLWSNYQAMCLAANDAGYVLDQTYTDYLAALPADLESNAVSLGYESAEAMVQSDMGVGSSVDAYLKYLGDYYLGYMYYGSALEGFTVTDAEVEAYFDEHAAEYQANGLEKTDECYVDVRHILISPEGGTTDESGATTYSEQEWAAAKTEAENILNQWLGGEQSEERFAELAGIYSVDGGSSSNGGLYEDVYLGQMVEPFENWCFDAARQHGDYGIVETTYGYHIMYFVGSDPVWYLTAYDDIVTELGNRFLEETLEAHPHEIDYSAIALGNVDLAAAQ